MQILHEKPPFYDRIVAAIPGVVDSPHAVFAYGDVIYNPSGKELPAYVIAHEQVHSEQQREVGKDWWWDMFLIDREFRFHEELIAYRAEYKEFCRTNKVREDRHTFLRYLAGNLSGPMYGNNFLIADIMETIRS